MDKKFGKIVFLLVGGWILIYILFPIIIMAIKALIYIVLWIINKIIQLLHGGKKQYEMSFTQEDGSVKTHKFWA